VLDEGLVPQETQDEGADQDNEHKGKEFRNGVLCLTRINKSLNHLSINNIFFLKYY